MLGQLNWTQYKKFDHKDTLTFSKDDGAEAIDHIPKAEEENDPFSIFNQI